ncbi:hypothetical protein BZG36_00912 [Bifiguratus adelaidae]|uniref:Uncharacterized protein n=1 Tax=Bifiguratus adelaidae TaxID=1938954 RepID=A0A261Y5I8_9FUNG|nr:hypothetical protein BZG36_00912 [Bifiguratus adelaidae]
MTDERPIPSVQVAFNPKTLSSKERARFYIVYPDYDNLPDCATSTYEDMSRKLASGDLSLITKDACTSTEDGFMRFTNPHVDEASSNALQCRIKHRYPTSKKANRCQTPAGISLERIAHREPLLPIETTMTAVAEYLKARFAISQDGITSDATVVEIKTQ